MKIDKTGIYAMYLRKSRADAEAEAREKFETLARHEQILKELAERYEIKISRTFRELVSGDTIEARPEMRILLAEVQAGVYDGVLVTEVSRLARGSTTDQGVVSEAFRKSKTLIITPSKIYDPTDEADETYFDFELFMARQEYKYIKKRMRRGRRLSFEKGNWIFPHVPIGYKKEGLRLVPGDYSEVMKKALTDLASGAKTQEETIQFLKVAVPILKWNNSSARHTFSNPIYAGYLRQGSDLPTSKNFNPDSYIKANCAPLISLQQHFDIVRRMVARAKTRKGYYLQNAFAGLIRCEKCGRSIVYNFDRGYPVLTHQYGATIPKCNCLPVKYADAFDELTEAILRELPSAEYRPEEPTKSDAAIKELEKELRCAEDIKRNLFSSFELGVYTASEFKDRKIYWNGRIDGLKRQIATLKRNSKNPDPAKVTTDDLKTAIREGSPEEVNELLKLIIDRIEYRRETKKEEPHFRLFFK